MRTGPLACGLVGAEVSRLEARERMMIGLADASAVPAAAAHLPQRSSSRASLAAQVSLLRRRLLEPRLRRRWCGDSARRPCSLLLVDSGVPHPCAERLAAGGLGVESWTAAPFETLASFLTAPESGCWRSCCRRCGVGVGARGDGSPCRRWGGGCGLESGVVPPSLGVAPPIHLRYSNFVFDCE